MRRPLAVGVAAIIATLAASASAPAQAPSGDSVTGGITVGFGMAGTWGFTIDARSGPSGESPTGTIQASNIILGGGTFSVSCLTVDGNRAAMLATLPLPVPFGQATLVLRVEDNGAAQDRAAFRFFNFPLPTPQPPPTDCPISTEGLEPVRFGDVTVVDAQPLPTSKDQCKDGGWQDFGDTFRNQGQCVAFVERGPKP
jgi:hypothetical protein